ncbi:MAG: histidine phosphatase family protein [Pseudomonadota bacterium]
MGEITLVRHGQANSAADNEEDYDQLSDLGRQQARWLGAWMAAHDKPYDVVMSGTLHRQMDTATEMGFPEATRDARLNEIAYYDLTAEMEALHPDIPRVSPEDFEVHFPATLTAWKDGHLNGQETWVAFQERVAAVLELAAQPGKRVLCVTSGGIIARAVSQILDLDIPHMARIAVPIYNTSVHRFRVRDFGPALATFNSAPHLDVADRIEARTYY